MPLFSNKVYDRLKWLVTIVLPATGALYYGLGQTVGAPASEQVVGTITIVSTFLGTTLGFSTKRYNNTVGAPDGSFEVTEDPGGMRTVHLSLNGDPEEVLTNKERVVFVVNKNQVE